MSTTDRRPAGPERHGGQGLNANQEESGARAIIALLTESPHAEQMDFVATFRWAGRPNADEDDVDPRSDDGAYEVWAKRGMVRFRRFIDDGGGYGYEVIEQIGENPIGNQDPTALSSIAEELEAGAKSGRSGSDANKAFVAPENISYPLAYERIAQLFDSPNAPDRVVNPKSYAFGRQPGQHGTLDVAR